MNPRFRFREGISRPDATFIVFCISKSQKSGRGTKIVSFLSIAAEGDPSLNTWSVSRTQIFSADPDAAEMRRDFQEKEEGNDSFPVANDVSLAW